jgi:ubiquinone/menaquinone biosynthesis C-methylase UbiE
MTLNHATPWYSEEGGLFDADYLDEYAKVIAPERTKLEVQFLIQTLNLRPGMRVLDLACGHGRHAIELAKFGCRIVGQDLNDFFLRQAKEDAQKAKVTIEWIKRDMREIAFESEFDVVINMFTAFGYLESDAEDQKVLQQVSKALKPNGQFLIDVVNREWLMRNYGTHMNIDRQYDFATGRNHEQRVRTWPNSKKTKKVKLIHRLYALHELVAMCHKEGLTYKTAFGNYDSPPLSFDSQRCIMLATKS